MRAASFGGCFFFNMNILFQAFNQLSTEIIITDLDFHIITMNESAASNGWKSDSLNHSKALERVISKSKINKSELPSLDSLIDDESFENLKEALEHTQQNSSATTPLHRHCSEQATYHFHRRQGRRLDLYSCCFRSAECPHFDIV